MPNQRRKFKSIAQKRIFESHIKKAGTCWLWMGDKNSGGHPVFSWKGQYISARRLAYEVYLRKIKWTEIPHLMCGNCSCVRPTHQTVIDRPK